MSFRPLELLIGRITLGEYAQDLVRSLHVAEVEHAEARADVLQLPGELYEELGLDLDRLGLELVDFRQAEKNKRGSRKGSRPWSQIDGEYFHQTAALIDDVERCVKIPAHVLITLTAVGLAHPPTAYLWHGHKGNRRFNGLEIACRAAGLEGDPRTFWRTKKERKADRTYVQVGREPTDEQLAAAFLVTRYHGRLNAINGHPHTLYGYHRGGHWSRRGDPGSRAALYLGRRCESDLGLSDVGPMGSGTATPSRWGGLAGIPYSKRIP